MDNKEVQFTEKLLRVFRNEAEEHLQVISENLLLLEKGQSETATRETIEKIFREAHSLKGAARAVNLTDIQDYCQLIEDVLYALKHNQLKFSKKLFDSLYSSIDLIRQILFASSPEDKLQYIDKIKEKLNELQQFKVDIDSEKNPLNSPQPAPIETESKIEEQVLSEPVDGIELDGIELDGIKIETKIESVRHNPSYGDLEKTALKKDETSYEKKYLSNTRERTIRVSIPKLDKLLQQIEEMLNIKLAAKQQVNDIKTLQVSLKEWDRKWTKAQSEIKNQKHDKKFLQFLDWQQQFIKTFREHLSRLAKNTNQEFRVLGGVVDNLLDDIKKVLMQPFSTILESFPWMIRDLSSKLKKEITFEVHGEDIEVDKRILEEIKDPLIHLIRNSIDHGIELPEERKKKNKIPQGKIQLIISQISGNRIEIQLNDDGRGISLQKIKERAIDMGLLSQKDSNIISDDDALKLIFHPGFSTSEIMTEISGRGIGLDVVSEKIDKLSGQVLIENKPGLGVNFRIILPMTLATFRGIYFSVSDQHFIMPTHNVTRVLRMKKKEIALIEDKETITLDGRILSFIHLGALLDLKEPRDKKSKLNESEYMHMLVVKASEKTIVFGIDQIIGEQEVLVKSFGKQLVRIKNFIAASITEWGKVIPILNPQDLIRSIKGNYSRKIQDDAAPISKKHTILVVEDSITSRVLLKNILESSGYEVKTCVDGMEGLERFTKDHVDLIVSDVEMPRMGGLELTKKIRETEKGSNIPIILCTSRESKEDREHGIAVGANAYLEKSTFAHTILLDVIHKFL